MTGRIRAMVTAVSATLAALTSVGLAANPAASAVRGDVVRAPGSAGGGIAPMYERTIGAQGKPNIGPSGIDVDGTGKLYVADTANSQVAAYDASGNQIWRVGTLGSTGPGNFSNPRDVAVDQARGLLFVADTAFNRVQVLSAATGAPMSVWSTKFQAAMGIHVGLGPSGGTVVLVADATLNRIDVFTETGTLLRTIGTAGAPASWASHAMRQRTVTATSTWLTSRTTGLLNSLRPAASCVRGAAGPRRSRRVASSAIRTGSTSILSAAST